MYSITPTNDVTLCELLGVAAGGQVFAVFDGEGKKRAVFIEQSDAEFHIFMREKMAGTIMIEKWNAAYTAALQGGQHQKDAVASADLCVETSLDGHIAELIARVIHSEDGGVKS